MAPSEGELFRLSQTLLDGELHKWPGFRRDNFPQPGFIRFRESDGPSRDLMGELNPCHRIFLDEAVPDGDVQGMFQKGVVAVDGGLCQSSLFRM